MLDADRETDIALGHACRCLLLGRQLRMRRRGRVDRKAPGIADIGDVVVHLERVDEPPARLQPALQLEADEPLAASLKVPVAA